MMMLLLLLLLNPGRTAIRVVRRRLRRYPDFAPAADGTRQQGSEKHLEYFSQPSDGRQNRDGRLVLVHRRHLGGGQQTTMLATNGERIRRHLFECCAPIA